MEKPLAPVICIRCQQRQCSCPLDPTELLLEVWLEMRRLCRQKALPALGATHGC